ncbi:MAG: Fe-S cluster assembly protein SufB [Candidatus Woesearchaeota archaeon]|nr:MAG: Fe-S cluster assembly protein SufB [Candidatus Woesearchaeota archaeon]
MTQDYELRIASVFEKNKEELRIKLDGTVTEEIVRKISQRKNEPQWMLDLRLKALHIFHSLPLPSWGPSLANLDLSKITYYAEPNAENATTWEEVPQDIKDTFEKLGIPESERTSLAGVGAQYESSTVYHQLKKEWSDKGIVFLDLDEAMKLHPEIVKKHFMTKCIPITDHKFIALHAAVWSGGTFLYVPKGVKLTMPVEAYFRMNSEAMGQFEHTLIIAEEGSEVAYVEGCSSPRYTKASLHAGCVEIFAYKGAKVKYSSVENWSKNTYNLNTKRALIHEDAHIEWIGANNGSSVTMLYPTSILLGDRASAKHIGIAYAGKDQVQDTGAKVVHIGKHTSSFIQTKSISKDGGVNNYRGVVKISPQAAHALTTVVCDALLFGEESQANTYPAINAGNDSSECTHEATTGRIDQAVLFYLMSRGLSEQEATALVVQGFINPVVNGLPTEYAVELKRLIELELEGAVG